MQTAITLPDDLFADADLYAEQVGMSRSQLYATALSEFLARHRDADVTAALDRVYAEPLPSIHRSRTQRETRCADPTGSESR